MARTAETMVEAVTKVKICGITNIEDAMAAVEFGADAIGFVFFGGSPRHITAERAKEIISKVPPFVTTVGVFVDEDRDNIKRTYEATGIDVVQFHGNEPPEACVSTCRVIKAIRVKDVSDLDHIRKYRVSAFLLDTYTPAAYGGTGQIFNWDIAVEAKRFGPVILAGGLTPENVAKAVKWVRPFAVDVSSGVEARKGEKDHEKLKLFIKRAKTAVRI